MNKIEKMEFLLQRMKDGKQFLVGGCGREAIYNFHYEKFCWNKPTGIEKINMALNDILDSELSLLPLHSFTDDEKVIMEHLPYPYLTRDKDGSVYNCKGKPKKDGISWVGGVSYKEITWLNHLFPTIQFENDEPVDRRDYL